MEYEEIVNKVKAIIVPDEETSTIATVKDAVEKVKEKLGDK